MITRFYLQNYLSFEEVELEFKKGLIVFSGISGAGKSVLMESILSLFGIKDAKAALLEGVIENIGFDIEEFDISSSDEVVFKKIQKDKSRYFLNNQTLSKKSLQDISQNFIRYIHIKDNSDFSNENLLQVLDFSLSDDMEFVSAKEEFTAKFKELTLSQTEFKKLILDEKNIEELKEFIAYEIKKIDDISPKVDEYEELSNIKKQLSQKEKIELAIQKATPIFEYTHAVNQVLDFLEIDSAFFDDAINELNNIFEKSNDSLHLLEETNIEEVLTRIEQLSSLQKKFGSIEEALIYKEQKKEELNKYENISFEKSSLEKKVKLLSSQIDSLTSILTQKRKKASKIIENRVNHYLQYLYLSNASFEVVDTPLSSSGRDMVTVSLKDANLENISSGEFNRLRLALMAVKSEYALSDSGVLFLDEIDANLSGKESGAIAKVLEQISKKYQVFAISHQAQLTSSASQHFLVEKQNGISKVYEINDSQRVDEIARMISGEHITQEAIDFARNLLK